MAMNAELKQQLQHRFSSRVRFDEPMAAHTSFKIGGPADVFVMPADESELIFLVKWVRENSIRFFILGWGTNLLVKDRGIRGIVISMTDHFNNITRKSSTEVSAMAGVILNKLCRYAIDNGLEGMNFALGIPGSVGGAIRMNAGTAYGSMSGVVTGIRILLPDGNAMNLDKSSLNFSYRGLCLSDKHAIDLDSCIITEGHFSFSQESPAKVKAEADHILKSRKNSQPVHLASAGCFFKNPQTGRPAGWLIDQAGLKGTRVGDAAVSEKHANFIYNRGNASAEDIIRLIDIVKTTVFKQFNITLEPEVKIVGE